MTIYLTIETTSPKKITLEENMDTRIKKQYLKLVQITGFKFRILL